MTNNDKLKEALRDIEDLRDRVNELENACAEHEGWIRELQKQIERLSKNSMDYVTRFQAGI